MRLTAVMHLHVPSVKRGMMVSNTDNSTNVKKIRVGNNYPSSDGGDHGKFVI
jgi:hypothetical protein